MAIDKLDPMAQFEEERAKARARTSTPPYFFTLKDGEKAQVRLLLNFDKQVRMDYHERYNASEQKFDVNAVCAAEFGQECAYCTQFNATKDWKLKAQRYAYLPVYVHKVMKQNLDKSWEPVTYKEDGQDKPVCGERMLAMKMVSSTILDDLAAAYYEDSDVTAERDITRSDFAISRRGSGLETKYTVTARSGAPLPLPPELKPYTQERVKTDVELHRPIKAVEVDPADAEDGL